MEMEEEDGEEREEEEDEAVVPTKQKFSLAISNVQTDTAIPAARTAAARRKLGEDKAERDQSTEEQQHVGPWPPFKAGLRLGNPFQKASCQQGEATKHAGSANTSPTPASFGAGLRKGPPKGLARSRTAEEQHASFGAGLRKGPPKRLARSRTAEEEQVPQHLVGATSVRQTGAGLSLRPLTPSYALTRHPQGGIADTDLDEEKAEESNHPSEIARDNRLSNLVVANPVVQESRSQHRILPEAEELDPQEVDENGGQPKRGRASMQLAVMVMVGLLLIMLVVAILLIVFLLPDKKNVQENPKDGLSESTTRPQVGALMPLLPAYTLAEIKRRGSPQFRAYEWLLNDPSLDSYTDGRTIQRFALATFFYSSNGEGWFNDNNWLSYEHHECDWWARADSGQYADNNRTILQYTAASSGPCGGDFRTEETQGIYRHLWLWNNGLKGTIPLELYLLTSLRSVAFTSNELSGTLSSHIGKLSHLEALALQDNAISGTIPTQIDSLSNLTGLFLFNNQLDGAISLQMDMLSKLEYLLLDSNRLSGPIPKGLGRLQKLKWLYLHKNLMTGEIPSDLFSNLNSEPSNLELLTLNNNLLTGSLPPVPAQFSSLRWIAFQENMLSAKIPTEYGNLDTLVLLRLEENNLSGPIPSELGLLRSIGYITLSRNVEISGFIPSELGSLFSLKGLEIGSNSLSGPIPGELGQLSSLLWLAFPGNHLSGKIPTPLCRLESLEILLLRENSFSDNLPTELGNMRALTNLGLNSNRLTGQMPSELGTLTLLTNLNLANNLLTGKIPSEIGSLVDASLLSFNISNNSFSGTIPSELCSLDPNMLGFDCSAHQCGCTCPCFI